MLREFEADAVSGRVGTVRFDLTGHAASVFEIELDGKRVLCRKLKIVVDAEQQPMCRVIADLLPVNVPVGE